MTVATKILTRKEWRKLDSDNRLKHIVNHDGEFRLTPRQVQSRRILRGILDNDLLVTCPGFGHSFFRIFGGQDRLDSIRHMERCYKHNKLDLIKTLIYYVKYAGCDDIKRVFRADKEKVIADLSKLKIKGE